MFLASDAEMELKKSGIAGLSFSLSEVLGMLWYGRRYIVLCTFVLGAIGFVYGMSKQPIYEAQGLLQVDPRSGPLNLPSGLENLLGGDTPNNAYRTLAEMQIVRSRSVMQLAVKAMDYDLVVTPKMLPLIKSLPLRMGLPYPNFSFLKPYRWGNETLIVSSFSIPETLRGNVFHLTTTDNGYLLRVPNGSEYTGQIGKLLEIKSLGVSILVSDLGGPSGREYTILRTSYDEAVARMQASFTAIETPINSSILRITFRDVEPRRAEASLDAIAAAYLEQDIARSAQEASSSLRFTEEQLPIARAAVDKAQAALNTYRSKANSIDVDYETRSLLEKETRIENDLSALDLRELDYKRRYTVTHPLYESLLKEREELRAQLTAVRAQTQELPDTQKEIYNITRDLQVAQQFYVQLLNSQQELQVAQAGAVGSVRVIDHALAADQHIKPQTGVIVGAAMVIGALIGAISVVSRAVMSRGVLDIHELEQLGLQVYGIVPAVAEFDKGASGKVTALVEVREISEAMRSLRTALHFGLSNAATKIISFTSVHPGAGKSFCSRHLAAAYAEAGQRVCLIDADMRRGVQSKMFALTSRKGLSEVLSGSLNIEQALQPGPVKGLYVLAAGTVPPNPSELLMSPRFAAMLETISTQFDIIVLDSPPVLAVTDPLIISKNSDCTLFIACHLETTRPEIEEAQRLFDLNNLKISGAVLNLVDIEKSKRYGRYDYSRRYAYYE